MICYLYPDPIFFFYSSEAPAILYYAQIPATVFALFVSFFAFWQQRQFLLNKLLFIISILFSFWTLTTLIAWTNVHSDLIIFIWSLFNIILGMIAIFCIYFIYVFLEKKDISVKLKTFFLVLLAPIFVLAPTYLNLTGFDITSCSSFPFESFYLKAYSTLLGVLAMVWILFLMIRRYRTATSDFKKQITLMGLGIELFLFSFFGMEFLATYFARIKVFSDSSIELYGLFGMVIFMTYISILIVRFKAFNIKLLASQALVWGLAMLIGSQLFFVKTTINFLLTGFTLLASVILGSFLIKGVKREIEQREKIERLAIDLEIANSKLKELDLLKSEFLSFASHQLRNPLTAVKGYASLVLEGDYGKVKPEITTVFQTIYDSTVSLLLMVQDFLDVTKITQGGMKYDMQEFDLRKLLEDIIIQEKPVIDEKGLTFDLIVLNENENYTILGDANKLKQVFVNVIDNSIKYTLKGSLKLILEKQTTKYIVSVKDTGVGISQEDIAKLFEKFSRATGARKINVTGSGLGLYLAKQIVEAHEGSVRVESPGVGLGSTFIIELPVL